MSIGEGIMVGMSVLAAVGFAAWCLWLVSNNAARSKMSKADAGSMLFAAWVARWVIENETRLSAVVAWLDQHPQWTQGMGTPTARLLAAGLKVFLDELPRLTGTSL